VWHSRPRLCEFSRENDFHVEMRHAVGTPASRCVWKSRNIMCSSGPSELKAPKARHFPVGQGKLSKRFKSSCRRPARRACPERLSEAKELNGRSRSLGKKNTGQLKAGDKVSNPHRGSERPVCPPGSKLLNHQTQLALSAVLTPSVIPIRCRSTRDGERGTPRMRVVTMPHQGIFSRQI
jgi:hypothetical protein